MSKDNINDVSDDILFDYLFHFNPYKQLWFAFKREHSIGYFNGTLKENEVIAGPDITGLITALQLVDNYS